MVRPTSFRPEFDPARVFGLRASISDSRARHRLVAVFRAILLLSAASCATYRPQPLSAEKTAAQWSERSLVDPGLRQFMERAAGQPSPGWPLASWDLSSLTLAAWYFHPDMATARAKLASAEADRRAASERPNPTFNFAPQYATNAVDLSPWTLGYSLDWPIETAGKRAKRTAVSSAQIQVARYDLGSAAWQVRNKIRAALVEQWASEEAVRLTEKLLENQIQLVRSLEQRRIAGEIALTIETEGRIALEQRRLALQDAKKRSRIAHIDLARAIGIEAHALDGVSISYAEVATPPTAREFSEDDFRRMAIFARSDILGGLADYAATEATLRLEIAKQYPDIHLGPGYTLDQGTKKWSLALGVTLPIFSRNRGPIGQAEAARSASATKFMGLQGQIIGELESAETEYRAALETLQVAIESEQRQRSQFATSDAQYSAGAIGQVEHLSSRSQYDEAALSRFNAQVQLQVALGALENALERPLDASGPRLVARPALLPAFTATP